VVNATPRSSYPRERDPVLTGAENLAPTKSGSTTVQTYRFVIPITLYFNIKIQSKPATLQSFLSFTFPHHSSLCISLLTNMYTLKLIWRLTHCLVYEITFNSDSFTLGFRLGLATLSFCSVCVLLSLYYLMCGVFCNVRVLCLYCVWVFL
jgi:hypothetical protein